MVTKSTLEEKLNKLNKIEKEYEEYDESYKDFAAATNFLSFITASFALSTLILYGNYEQQIAQEHFSLSKFAFQYCAGVAGGIGALNLMYLGLTGMEYLGLKEMKKERDKLRIDCDKMQEDYKFSRGYD